MESNLTFIIGAYAVTWAALLGYLVYLTRRGARARAAFGRATTDTGAQAS